MGVRSERILSSESMLGTPAWNLETILVVDDNPAVLTLVVRVLNEAGFRVLSAVDRASAIEVARRTEGSIDLLLSDVDMPEMSGPNLGESLMKARPKLLVMLISGGPAGNRLVLSRYGWAFIQRPFLPTRLVQMIIDVLRSSDRSQPGDCGSRGGGLNWCEPGIKLDGVKLLADCPLPG